MQTSLITDIVIWRCDILDEVGRIMASLEKCIYCKNDLIEGGVYCATCSKFQQPWRNWITDLGNVTGALTMAGAILVFSISMYSSFQENRASRLAQEDADTLKAVSSVLNSLDHIVVSIDHVMTRYDEASIAIETERHLAEVRAGYLLVKELPGECLSPDAVRCRLGLFQLQGLERLLSVSSSGSPVSAELQHIREYIQGLVIILSAESISQIARGTDGAIGAIKKIGSGTAAPSAPMIDTPRSQLEDHDVRDARWLALQSVTTTATTVLSHFPNWTGDINQFKRYALIDGYMPKFQEAVERFRKNPTLPSLKRLSEAAKTFDTLLSSSLQFLLVELTEAHTAMAMNMQPNASFQSAVDRLSNLQGDINVLERVLDEILAEPLP